MEVINVGWVIKVGWSIWRQSGVMDGLRDVDGSGGGRYGWVAGKMAYFLKWEVYYNLY